MITQGFGGLRTHGAEFGMELVELLVSDLTSVQSLDEGRNLNAAFPSRGNAQSVESTRVGNDEAFLRHGIDAGQKRGLAMVTAERVCVEVLNSPGALDGGVGQGECPVVVTGPMLELDAGWVAGVRQHHVVVGKGTSFFESKDVAGERV